MAVSSAADGHAATADGSAGDPAVTVDLLILAGGRGERLGGQDKAALEVGGRSLLDRVLEGAGDLGGDVVVVGDTPVPAGVLRTLEDPPDGGPVAGIATGLAALDAAASGERERLTRAGDAEREDRRLDAPVLGGGASAEPVIDRRRLDVELERDREREERAQERHRVRAARDPDEHAITRSEQAMLLDRATNASHQHRRRVAPPAHRVHFAATSIPAPRAFTEVGA